MTDKEDQIHLYYSHIPQVLHFFELSEPIKTEVITTGFANHNIAIETKEGKFVIKFLNKLRLENIKNDIAIQEQLNENKIGTIQYLHNQDGNFLYQDDDIPAVVSHRIEGINPPPYSQDTADALGRALGEFHITVKKLPHEHKAWLNPSIATRPIKNEKDPLTMQARELISKGIELFNADLPHGIIHSDLHEDNAIILAKEPTHVAAIMDFEEAEKNVFLVDMARAILSVCRDKTNNLLDHSLIKKYLEAYNQQRKITNIEAHLLEDAIYYAGGVAMIWFIENDYPEFALQYAKRAQNFTASK